MDYDKTTIPKIYDAGRDVSVAKKKLYLEFFADNIPADKVSDIVDLGCGTARFSEILADVFDARVVGIDPSQKMLDQAHDKTNDSRITYRLASGEALPLDCGSADMVFMSMVLHHLQSPQITANECHRVLRNDGHVCIRNTTANEILSYPYLDVFPSIQSIIEEQLISREQLSAMFDAAGFELTAQQTVWHEVASDWRTFADKIALKADSFVARLEEDELESGLVALREKANTAAASEAVGLNVDLFTYRRL